MSQTPKYLVAKYIPDMQRLEPRNIGIVVWTAQGIAARFMAEFEGKPGEVDGRSVPGFVQSLSSYKQWIKYWRNELTKESISPIRGGGPVRRTSSEFLETLMASNNQNFVLVEGGVILDRVGEDELQQLADYLYSLLIETGASEEPRDITLEEVCDDLLERSGLSRHRNFHSDFTVPCPVAGTTEEFIFSHALKNGSIQRLYQRVPFPKKKKTVLRKTIHDSAWTFEKIVAARIVDQEKTAALVYLSAEQREDDELQKFLTILRSVTIVLDLSLTQQALGEFERAAISVSQEHE